MSGVIGDKQWEEFRRLEAEYIEAFGEIDFTTLGMDTGEIISIFKSALASGKPVYDEGYPEEVFI